MTSPAVAQSAAVAQLVERVLGKDEAMGPNPISSFCIGLCEFVQPTRLIERREIEWPRKYFNEPSPM